MGNLTCKLLIIGAGPGGYAAAIRAGQLGIDTIIVDRQKPGGTCLNVGCIPSKALIHVADEFQKSKNFTKGGPSSSFDIGIEVSDPTIDLSRTIAWKDNIVKRLNNGVAGLIKRAGTQFISGSATIMDGKNVRVKTDTDEHIISCENMILATGSKPVEIKALPFGGDVISSTQSLSLEKIPKTMAIIGGGYIGLELGIAFAKMGAKITIFEAGSRLLPHYSEDLVAPVVKSMKALGIDIRLNAIAKGLIDTTQELMIENSDGETESSVFDKILVTVGRTPVIEGFGLEDLMLTMKGHFIDIDDRCQSSMRGVYAIGDITGDPMLAHRATAQGEMVAEIIAGKSRVWNNRIIPAVCFTDPEIVTVGMSAKEAAAEGQKAGFEIVTNIFPFMANGRAMTMESEEGFVQIIARADNHVILGVHAVGSGVSELSSSFVLAIEMGARLEDIAATIHAHPTQSEAFAEAAMRTLGHSLHI